MIKKIYSLQVFYGNNWVEVDRFVKQDRAVMAAKPYVENSTYSEVQVLEIFFDTETKRFVESWPLDLEYFLEKAKGDSSKDKSRRA